MHNSHCKAQACNVAGVILSSRRAIPATALRVCLSDSPTPGFRIGWLPCRHLLGRAADAGDPRPRGISSFFFAALLGRNQKG
jgi:hypothetical protein